MFVVMTFSCFCAACLATFGVRYCLWVVAATTLLLLLTVPVALVWGVLYRFFPEPTKYVSVFGIIGAMLLLPLPGLLLASREQTRRDSCSDQLRHLGMRARQIETLQNFDASKLDEKTKDKFWERLQADEKEGFLFVFSDGPLNEPR